MTSASPPSVAVAILAAGSGTRFGGEVNKAYLPLDGVPMVVWSLRRAARLSGVEALVLVVSAAEQQLAAAVVRDHDLPPVDIVVGGASRHASEWAAIQSLADRIDAGTIDIVVIHDGARPYADDRLFADIVDTAAHHGGAIPARPQPAVVAVDPAEATPGSFVTVQTPQAFRARALLAAYAAADREGFDGTDTASTAERFSDLEIVVVPGPAANVKITYPTDAPLRT